MAGDKDLKKPSESDGAQDGQQGSPSSNFAERLSKLEANLVKKGALKKQNSKDERSENSAQVAQAMKISSEFIAGIVVGALIGWSIDQVAATSPWGLIIFLMLGFAAGVLNVLRVTGKVAEKDDLSLRAQEHEKE
ncbi:ATP synthase protein I [Paenochrobactrum gallinarii]|uniref:ATP synthase protein I n=1 Tax=Paenochrobactrum gallinarii TaxID=643673 RepID=A0A841M6R1_9HYPH|nr:AtpZ/AtpI family protein [Paenochrobactrum gallinarii]MBB6261828.1 ATP synthase protein I [Paenochrobactrum gallinarii]